MQETQRQYASFIPMDDLGKIPEALLERIRGQIGNEKLDLSLCNITSIPTRAIKDLFGEPGSLDLSFNIIRQVSIQFPSVFANLSRLDLSRNEIRILPDNFGMMKQLKYLDLHQNQLSCLPLSLNQLADLVYLDISENPFRAPLCEFLCEREQKMGREMACSSLANLVIEFLRELEVELLASGDSSGDEKWLKGKRPRKSVTFNEDTCESSATTEDENENHFGVNGNLKKPRRVRAHIWKSNRGQDHSLLEAMNLEGQDFDDSQNQEFDKTTLPRIILMLIVVYILMVPFLLACFVDASFIDELLEGLHPCTSCVARGWRSFKPIYNGYANVARWISPNHLRIRGSNPGNELETVLGMVVNTFAAMYRYVRDSVSLLFH